METLLKADIFFFVTTICVVFISIFLIILLARLSKFMESLRALSEKLKEKVEDVGEEAEELLEKIEDSFIFRLLFWGKKKTRKKKR